MFNPLIISYEKKEQNQPLFKKAVSTINGFEKVKKTLEQQVALKGQSHSTLDNYLRRVALISLHFGKLPEQVKDEELNEYLTALALDKTRRLVVLSSTWSIVYGITSDISVKVKGPFRCLLSRKTLNCR